MANIGKQTVGASEISFEGYLVQGMPYTMSEDGEITSMTAYIVDNGGSGAHSAKCILYDNNDSADVLGETETRNNISTAGWYTFNFSTPIAVTNGTTYRFAVAGSTGGATIGIFYDTGSSGDNRSHAITWPTIPDPTESWDTGNYQISLYATYTPNGGAGAAIAAYYNMLRNS